MPTIAAVIAFVTYSLTGHPLNPAIIFTALTLFNLLRMPLMLLRKFSSCISGPSLILVIAVSLGTIADARNATERLRDVFEAELLEDTFVIDDSIDNAVEVKNASFTWDAPPPDTSDNGQRGKKKPRNDHRPASRRTSEADDTSQSTVKDDNVFQLRDINLTIPRGQLVAIVGPVGCGKSSLLQGLIGEMRRTTGSVVFGGGVGYCPQIPWIQVTRSDFANTSHF
jgi:ABC-type multidrug transport system fused ATPase/permease subunit